MARAGYCKHGTYIGYFKESNGTIPLRTNCIFCSAEQEAQQRQDFAYKESIKAIVKEVLEEIGLLNSSVKEEKDLRQTNYKEPELHCVCPRYVKSPDCSGHWIRFVQGKFNTALDLVEVDGYFLEAGSKTQVWTGPGCIWLGPIHKEVL